MSAYLYYIILGIYSAFLLASLVYYLSRKAPTGDASVGWAMGLFYLAGLAGVVVLAFLLRKSPAIGLCVLSIPLVWLAIPRIRFALTNLYARFPSYPDTPPLTIHIVNNTQAMWHVKFECWFGKENSASASLYTTLDYYLEPMEKASYALSKYETGLLAHKSKYVSISTFERVKEVHEGHEYIREIQPCLRFYEEIPEAFRQGNYTVKT